MEQKRENFGSRLGFILVSAGCAIGIGNVWKFPYVAGQNGGAVFVLFYLLFLLIMGIPVLTMEIAMGRASRRTIVGSYKALEKDGQKWHLHGYVCMAGNYLLMMYYSVIAGWMVAYFWKFLSGTFDRIEKEAVPAVYGDMLMNPFEMTIFMVIVVTVGFAVLTFGVRKGLERVNKIMMTGLLGLIIFLAFNSFSLSGAQEGLRFFLLPNLDNVKKVGLLNVITAAMNQSFFTLSLGIASMEVFGSYMSDEYALPGEAVKICILDTLVALMSGLIIFPACFSFGIQPEQGPSLIFVTLPWIFMDMNMGRLCGAMFFLFMTFASFSTVIGVFENLTGMLMDNFGWSRKKAVLFNAVFILAASMPALLGYNILSGVDPLPGKNILDTEDFIVSNILLPTGSLIFLLFCVTDMGWGADNYFAEVNKGSGPKMNKMLTGYLRFVLPVLILIILVNGLI